MTREEEIQEAAIEARCAVATSLSGDNYNSIDGLPLIDGKISYDELIENAFIRGAEWADKHTAKNQTATIDAWVARDFNGILGIYGKQPKKQIASYTGDFKCLINGDLFPSVTFDNSPKKVKVTIELENE